MNTQAPEQRRLPQLSIVIPVRDEAGNVLPLLSEVDAALAKHADYEVLVVDDGSRDATAKELRDARKSHRRLRVLTHSSPCGQSAALRTGVMAARGAWIATLDGDGQNDPADILRLLEVAHVAAAQNRDFLIAGHRTRRQDSWLKKVSSRIANRVRSRLLGDATPDTGCGLKVFGRDAFLTLPYFDHMHRFLPALMLRAGGQVISVGVSHRYRQRGSSKYGTLDRLLVGIVDLMGVMWLQRRSSLPHVQESADAVE
ncbi:glycosyltransferase family 2 protein [Thiococcus pfennigii]|uniref:glycosyltransferase family 2 protein n=1 Tax=Thiococcus pfennigii TaxID=1057 RepID=UPI001902F973|nr:glycosyltransferase family 2 protein [Thiococcus pfennigii]MBK1731748.1 dolichol-phosphate mannosyltransferase [Thiococcus pfennigii]